MRCEEALDLFEDRLDGPLPALDRHMEGCVPCRDRWSAFSDRYGDLREAHALPPLPEGVTARVLARLDQEGLFQPALPGPWERLAWWLRGGLAAGTVGAWLLLAASLAWVATVPEIPTSQTLSPELARAWSERSDPLHEDLLDPRRPPTGALPVQVGRGGPR